MHNVAKRRLGRRGYVFVAYLATFQDQWIVTVRIMGRPLSVFRRPDGTFFSREMACNHQGADLSLGKFVDNIVTCPRHGRKYNIDTGECLDNNTPALREHNVAIVGDAVYVSVSPRPNSPTGGRMRPRKPPVGNLIVNGKPASE